MKNYDPSAKIFDLLQFGEYGDVNPSVTDSATFTFMQAKTMLQTFKGEAEGCFLYSRHWNPSNKYLADAIAAMEGTEAAWVTASGMSAITNVIMQICNAGDHIVASITTYGGTYAFLANYIKKFNISVTFVDISRINMVESAIRPNTRLVYTESLTNPLLQVADIPALSEVTGKHGINLVVDNTFCPMIISPSRLGADITVYSLTKFVNGKNDCLAGAMCGKVELINSMIDVNNGTSMLLGPVLDPFRSSSILKNMHTLHIRMQQHSRNALYIAEKLQAAGLRVIYPGLANHPGHEIMKRIMHPDFGYGGVLAVDMKTADIASEWMEKMESAGVGYLAVSLGYYKTLFSNSGKSTSSEIPEDLQHEMGMSEGLVRISVGLDHDIHNTCMKMMECLPK